MTLRYFAADDPGAPVLLVQPAMGMKASFYAPLAEALRADGQHVVLASLRGHEESGGRRPSRGYDFGYAEMVDDLGLAVAAARDRFPDSLLHLLGHSLGGHLSLLFAAAHPEQVDGVVLVASSTVHWRAWPLWMLPATHACAGLAAVFGHFPGNRIGFAGREARGVISDWARLSRTGRFEIGRPRADQSPALARLELPVLSISVEGDWLAPPHAADALAALAESADLTRVHLTPEIPMDHYRWARQPAEVVETITDWTAERDQRPARTRLIVPEP